MGNISEQCCDSRKRNISLFSQCEDLSQVQINLEEEIKKVQDIAKFYSRKNSQIFTQSNYPDQMKKFYYYLKLEIVLVKVKSLIDINILKAETKLDWDNVKNVSNFKRRDERYKTLTTDIRVIENNFNEKQMTETIQQIEKNILQRKDRKSKTTKSAIYIDKKIDFSDCVKLICEILETEEYLNEEDLNILEKSLEMRMFNFSKLRSKL
jgi:hypothetical protein